MTKKVPAKIRVIRKGESVDPRSTQIRSDQAERLKLERSPQTTSVLRQDHVKLMGSRLDPIYTAGKLLECAGCVKVSPTRRMFHYKKSSRGPIYLCESCHDLAEVRSFYALDALDRGRRKVKVS